DFHGREAQVVDVLNPVPQRPPFAGQRDSRRSKTDHELTPRKKPTLDYYSGLPDISIFAPAGRPDGPKPPAEPAAGVAPSLRCSWPSPLSSPQTFKSLRSFGVRPRPRFHGQAP